MAKNEFMQKLAVMPLYEGLTLTKDEFVIIKRYLEFESIQDDSIDLYCTACKGHSIFKPSNKGQLPSKWVSGYAFAEGELPFGSIHFSCTRDETHIFEIQIAHIGESIIKIGQFPSKADIENPEWNKYSKIIPSTYLSDIKKAIGLSAHGIGAGSFVYLRRVMEYLINEAYKKALSNPEFDNEKYHKSRIVEKIIQLKDYLPKILVDNKEAYSILSKGVHELEESECLENFDLLKTTIELILDEILNDKNREERELAIKSGITQLHSQLKSK